MRALSLGLVLSAVFLSALAGCGDDGAPGTDAGPLDATSPDGSGCAPGETIPCTCTGGLPGTAPCLGGGGFGPCACEGFDGGPPDAATPDAAAPDAGPPPEWPPTPEAYVPGVVARVQTLTVPAITDSTADCCRDFGPISRDFIERGENGIDNAIARVAELLSSTGYDLQAVLDGLLSDGTLNLLLDHQGLDAETDPAFTMVIFDGVGDGAGGYLIARSSFLPGTGTPRSVFFPASVAAGAVTAGPGDAYIPVPFGPALTTYRFRGTIVEGALSLASGARYASGQLSGYLTVADYFGGINDVVATQCGCLGLAGPLYEPPTTAGGRWTHACTSESEATLRCADPSEAICVDLGSGTGCSISPIAIPGTADLDLDASTPGYEALSFGLRFTASPAVVRGVAAP